MVARYFILLTLALLAGSLHLFGVGELGSGGSNLDVGLSKVDSAAKSNKPAGPPARSFYSVKLEALYFPHAEMDGKDGELSEKSAGVEFSWNRFAAFNNFTQIMGSYTARNYDVEKAEPYAGSFTEVNAFRIGSTFERPIGDRWSAFVVSRVSLQSAKGTSPFEGWNVPFSAGVGYMFHPKFIVSAGALGIFQAQLGTTVIPIVTLRWTPTDRLTIMTLNGIRVGYKLGEKKEWEILSSVVYETFVFAVTDLEGFDEQQGVVSQEYFQARIGLSRKFGRMFEVGFFLESRFDREFEYYKDDKKFDEFGVDSSIGFRLDGTFRF